MITEIKNLIDKPSSQGVIAFIIIIAGFCFLAFTSLDDVIKSRVSDLMFLVATYYFGSSSGSSKKDEVIKKLQDQK